MNDSSINQQHGADTPRPFDRPLALGALETSIMRQRNIPALREYLRRYSDEQLAGLVAEAATKMQGFRMEHEGTNPVVRALRSWARDTFDFLRADPDEGSFAASDAGQKYDLTDAVRRTAIEVQGERQAVQGEDHLKVEGFRRAA